jgi:hypothetical protein
MYILRTHRNHHSHRLPLVCTWIYTYTHTGAHHSHGHSHDMHTYMQSTYVHLITRFIIEHIPHSHRLPCMCILCTHMHVYYIHICMYIIYTYAHTGARHIHGRGHNMYVYMRKQRCTPTFCFHCIRKVHKLMARYHTYACTHTHACIYIYIYIYI